MVTCTDQNHVAHLEEVHDMSLICSFHVVFLIVLENLLNVLEISQQTVQKLLRVFFERPFLSIVCRKVMVELLMETITQEVRRIVALDRRGVVDVHLHYVQHVKASAFLLLSNTEKLLDSTIHPFRLAVRLWLKCA